MTSITTATTSGSKLYRQAVVVVVIASSYLFGLSPHPTTIFRVFASQESHQLKPLPPQVSSSSSWSPSGVGGTDFLPPLPPHCHHHHQQLHSLQPVGNGISWLPSKGVQQQQQRSSFSRLRRPLAPVVCVCVCRLGHHSTPLSFAFTLSLSHRDPMTTIASRAVRRPP